MAQVPHSLLVLAPSAYPLGGVATWLSGLLPALRELGWKVRLGLLAGRHHDAARYLEAHPDPESIALENPGGSREGRIRALVRAIRTARPEVVLSVNVADVEGAVDRVRRTGPHPVRLAVSQHAIHPSYFVHLREHRCVVDGVICTNRLTADLATRYAGVVPERVHYAPYGVRSPRPARGEPAPGLLRVAWAGRFEQEQKRIYDVPDVLRELDQIGLRSHWTLAGAGPEEGLLRSRLTPWIAEGRVRFAGPVDQRHMANEVYSRSDVLLITSAWETGPIVAWEALASGLAIATSRFLGSGLEGALHEGLTAAMFPVGDTRGAAEALARTADEASRSRLAEAGRALVETRYSLESAHAQWAAALAAIADGPALEPNTGELPVWPAGRLERLFGSRVGEALRRRVGIHNPQSGPGEEWPHAYGRHDAPGFWELAREVDLGPAEVARGEVAGP